MALADTARLIASLELQDKFSPTARRVEGSLGGLERKVAGLGRVGQTASRGLGTLVGNLARFGTAAAAIGIGGAAAAITLSVRAASDLNEEIDKSAVVFGNAAPEVQAFAENAASIGLSSAEALGAAGNFGNMLNTIGLAQDESADMSQTMVQLAADMASFNNEDPSDMLDRLRSGLAGEAEPLRRFGVLLSAAEVEAFAYANGIAEVGDELTEAEKVQARYGLILEQTTIQQGNFTDTSELMANQQRQLRANISNTAATFGTAFLPAISRTLRAINELFIDKQPEIRRFGEVVGEVVDSLFSSDNLDTGIAKVGGFIDKLAGVRPEGLELRDRRRRQDGEPRVVHRRHRRTGSRPPVGVHRQRRATARHRFEGVARCVPRLPPWVQTAVLTGWGLNKLTGGALGSIFGTLASGIIRGVLNMNAGVVNINAGTVTGGGGGVAGGGRGGGIGGRTGGRGRCRLGWRGSPSAPSTPIDALDATWGNRYGTASTQPTRRPSPASTNGSASSTRRSARRKATRHPTLRYRQHRRGRFRERARRTATGTRRHLPQHRPRHRLKCTLPRPRQPERRPRARRGQRIPGRRCEPHSRARATRTRLRMGTSQAIRDKKSSVNVQVNNSIDVSLSASQVALQIQRINLTTNSRNDIDEAFT